MKSMIREWERPYGRDDLAYVRERRDGACWRAGDGLEVRLAAPEREVKFERGRLSLVGVMLAWLASRPHHE